MAVSWLKKGSDSQALEKAEAAQQELRRQQAGKLYRFFLKQKEEAKLTFVDGELSPEGFLIPPRFYEHMIQVAGQWQTFVCPEKTNPQGGDKCPICAGGDNPALISLFTVIDHRSFKLKDGTTIPYSKKLLAAKTGTMELLAKQALKRGGLAGCTFEVSRTSSATAPAVGDVWDFVEKRDLELLTEAFMTEMKGPDGKPTKQSLFVPADYEQEIVFYTGEELLAKGVGGSQGMHHSPGGKNTGAAGNYKSQL